MDAEMEERALQAGFESDQERQDQVGVLLCVCTCVCVAVVALFVCNENSARTCRASNASACVACRLPELKRTIISLGKRETS